MSPTPEAIERARRAKIPETPEARFDYEIRERFRPFLGDKTEKIVGFFWETSEEGEGDIIHPIIETRSLKYGVTRGGRDYGDTYEITTPIGVVRRGERVKRKVVWGSRSLETIYEMPQNYDEFLRMIRGKIPGNYFVRLRDIGPMDDRDRKMLLSKIERGIAMATGNSE